MADQRTRDRQGQLRTARTEAERATDPDFRTTTVTGNAMLAPGANVSVSYDTAVHNSYTAVTPGAVLLTDQVPGT